MNVHLAFILTHQCDCDSSASWPWASVPGERQTDGGESKLCNTSTKRIMRGVDLHACLHFLYKQWRDCNYCRCQCGDEAWNDQVYLLGFISERSLNNFYYSVWLMHRAQCSHKHTKKRKSYVLVDPKVGLGIYSIYKNQFYGILYFGLSCVFDP